MHYTYSRLGTVTLTVDAPCSACGDTMAREWDGYSDTATATVWHDGTRYALTHDYPCTTH